VACLLLLLSLVGCSGPAQPLPAVAAPAAAGAPEPVKLLSDASIFRLVGGMIEHARRRVLIEVYEIWRPDLIEEMSSARERSLDVRIITDPTAAASRTSALRLSAPGVPNCFYPIDDRAQQIDHVKLLVADDEGAVGGMNWGAHSDRSEVARLVRIFEQDWLFAGGRPAPIPPVATEVAQTAPGEEIRRMLESSLGPARRRALAEIYTLTDPDVLFDLASARWRGVDVRVLLDPNQAYNLHAFDVLSAAGVPVRWYPIPAGALLHAKIALCGGTLVLGSANWTYSGLDVNHELDIETVDPGGVGAYTARFAANWARSPAP